LRVLQEREFERVGGTGSIRADVRVIAATNRDLQAAIAGNTFRSDLFYRLNVFPIEVPPLRVRREDIPVLVAYFIDRFARKAGKSIRSVDYRLNVFPIPVPALRDRAEDIPLLATHFVRKYAKRMQKQVKGIPAEAMNALSAHSWPGNIRELQNFIERSVILTTGRTLCPRLEGLRQTTKDELPEATTL
jgi:transcriptional regulator with PAS, ATPase and Fis domain